MANKRLSRNPTHSLRGGGTDHGGPLALGLEPEQVSVGRRLRELRTLRGISMRSLAEMSGLNINTLSLIENQRSSPSVSTLQQLSQSLRVPLTEFFRTYHGSLELVHQRQGERPRVLLEVGMMEDLASGMVHPGHEPLLLTLQRGAHSGKTPIVHTGREFVYCLEGCIAYTVQEREYLLQSGDSLCFEAYLPHSWKNPGQEPARLLLVLCTTDVRDSPMDRHFLKRGG
jgi:transcriptional regulator with XRE-family HTH domain